MEKVERKGREGLGGGRGGKRGLGRERGGGGGKDLIQVQTCSEL